MNGGVSCIVTGTDGFLRGTEAADVAPMIRRVTQAPHVVLHLHGGLVKEETAMAKARELAPFYRSEAGAEPIFAIYRTGLGEIVGGHLLQIAKESVFSIIREKVLKWIVGKIEAADGARSAATALPTDIEVKSEIARLPSEGEPFGDLNAAAPPAPLTPDEERAFKEDLEQDDGLRRSIDAIAAGAAPDEAGSRSAGVAPAGAAPTMMSPEVIDELTAPGREAGARGFGIPTAFLIRAAKILARTVSRLRKGRDHGVYCTVVEEILRELYVANIGAAVWNAMKSEPHDTFLPDADRPRGGTCLLRQLGLAIRDGARPRISLVAHSMGSVYAAHFIRAWQAAAADPNHPLPEDARLGSVIFLAPAIDTASFASLLRGQREYFDRFRMLTLSDAAESGYWEVPGVYPRSLLYFVSGVVEREAGGDGAFDLPILGMARYLERPDVYSGDDETSVRAFLAERGRVVFSPAAPGGASIEDAMKHGEFDDLEPRGGVMRSVGRLLREGAP